MKTAAIAIVAFAFQAVAAEVDPAKFFPACSLECLNNSKLSATDCTAEDSWCFCIHENYEAIYEDSMDCVIDACGEEVAIASVLPAAEPFCEAATSAYSATATSPLPTHTHSHDDEEEEDDHDATTTGAASTGAASSGAATTPTPTSAAETSAAASGTETSASAVSTGAAAQIGSMGVAAMLALGAIAAL